MSLPPISAKSRSTQQVISFGWLPHQFMRVRFQSRRLSVMPYDVRFGSDADTPYVNEARLLQPPEQTSAEVSSNPGRLPIVLQDLSPKSP